MLSVNITAVKPSANQEFADFRLHGYAQTNIQLYRQLLAAGYSSDDLRRIREAYGMAAVLFAGRFQPSRKTFISHVVGTASILASVKSNADLVCAGLLHNVYHNGEFGGRKRGMSRQKRSELATLLGANVEKYVAAFFVLPWDRKGFVACVDKLETLDPFERGALLIRAADGLEKLLDLEALYYPGARYYIDNAPVYIELSKKLGVPVIGEEIRKFLDQCQSSEMPSALCHQAGKHNSEVVVPLSYRFKICAPMGYRAKDWFDGTSFAEPSRLKRLYWRAYRSFSRNADAVRRRWLGSKLGCVEIRAKGCATLFADGKLERITMGFKFSEGPVWVADENSLLFSDIPANRIIRLTADRAVTTFRQPSGNANGLTLDQQGRLVACEHGNRRVTRTEKDGTITVIADRFDKRRLNSPNDVVVRSDGTVYFTDPPYGIKPEETDQVVNGVYRVSADTGEITLVADDFDCPNGLAFSPDEKRIYIDDSGRRHIRVFDVQDDGSVSNGRILHDMNVDTPGAPDGMKVDTQGNVYCTGAGGVWIFSPQGRHLGTIVTPEKPSNCAWGDADWRSLYITAQTSIYRIRLTIAGIALSGSQSATSDRIGGVRGRAS